VCLSALFLVVCPLCFFSCGLFLVIFTTSVVMCHTLMTSNSASPWVLVMGRFLGPSLKWRRATVLGGRGAVPVFSEYYSIFTDLDVLYVVAVECDIHQLIDVLTHWFVCLCPESVVLCYVLLISSYRLILLSIGSRL